MDTACYLKVIIRLEFFVFTSIDVGIVPFGQFYRRFSLPQTADDAKITARYAHGVLEIRIPKREAATEKKLKSV